MTSMGSMGLDGVEEEDTSRKNVHAEHLAAKPPPPENTSIFKRVLTRGGSMMGLGARGEEAPGAREPAAGGGSGSGAFAGFMRRGLTRKGLVEGELGADSGSVRGAGAGSM